MNSENVTVIPTGHTVSLSVLSVNQGTSSFRRTYTGFPVHVVMQMDPQRWGVALHHTQLSSSIPALNQFENDCMTTEVGMEPTYGEKHRSVAGSDGRCLL